MANGLADGFILDSGCQWFGVNSSCKPAWSEQIAWWLWEADVIGNSSHLQWGHIFNLDQSGSSLEKESWLTKYAFGCYEPNIKKVWIVSQEGRGYGTQLVCCLNNWYLSPRTNNFSFKMGETLVFSEEPNRHTKYSGEKGHINCQHRHERPGRSWDPHSLFWKETMSSDDFLRPHKERTGVSVHQIYGVWCHNRLWSLE